MGGLLGGGGGFIMVPLLGIWAKFPQRQANATSLVAIIPIGLVAVAVYYFRKMTPQVDVHFALFLIIGSVAGAYIGARLVNRIPDRALSLAVAIVLVIVGIDQLLFP
jgi:uncharacterized membrane protein YfcA